MKAVTYKLFDTTLYDYTLIEERLTRLAAQGWHLEKVGTLAWKFRRGEPKAVRYAVTYAPSASAYNSRPTEAEEDLTDLCAQAGWERVANVAQLHVYRNEDPNATPLETDERERLKNIQKTMVKHFFPAEALQIVIFLLQFFMHLRNLTRWPSSTLSSPMMTSTLVMCLFVAAVHGILALNAVVWLCRAKRAVDAGDDIPVNRFYRRFRWVISATLIGYLLCLLWTVGLDFAVGILVISAAAILTAAGCMNLCKRLNAPRWVNMAAPVVLVCILISVLTPALVYNLDYVQMHEDPPPAADLPVTLTMLTGETDTERSIPQQSSSLLSSYGAYWDTGSEDWLRYTIVDVKCPLFYDMLLNEQEDSFKIAAHYSVESEVAEYAALFGAEYVRHAPSTLGDRWFICWDSRIVTLKASWELTEDQLATLAELLKPQ